MSDNKDCLPFEAYIIQGDDSLKQRAARWQIAIGLQEVDRLQPSSYLLDTAKQHIEGVLDLATVQQRIVDYYQTTEGRRLAASRTDEADIVASRMMSILSEEAFSFIPAEYARLHRRLFQGLFKHAGTYRTVNISKKEWVLDGESVIYAPYDLLQETIEYDFAQERQFSYQSLTPQEALQHICKFIAGLWQIHPFMEGNTRTTALFTIFYLRKFGFQVSNEPFARHAWFFRNALVRANYNDYAKGIRATTRFLEQFFENLIFNGQHVLKNRTCHIQWEATPEVQSATSKCKKCTLEEVAILNLLTQTPTLTQKEIAREIGKSERTIKNIMKGLKEKALLLRKKGKRNGYWEVQS